MDPPFAADAVGRFTQQERRLKPELQQSIRRPILARHARYRRDSIRQEHQLVFPEGVLVLNDSGAAIVRLCDGRTTEELVAELKDQFDAADPAADVHAFLNRLAAKGLLRDAAES